MSDTTLREALERIDRETRHISGNAGRLGQIAREALAAASQEREPEWEYRMVQGSAPWQRWPISEVHALVRLRQGFHGVIERRVKAGEWQRAPEKRCHWDECPHGSSCVHARPVEPKPTDSLAKPLDQGDNL